MLAHGFGEPIPEMLGDRCIRSRPGAFGFSQRDLERIDRGGRAVSWRRNMVDLAKSGFQLTHRTRARSRGFSVVELLMVMAIIAIMIAMALPTIFQARRVYAVDDASTQVIDILQFAQQRALAERQIMRVDIVAGTDSTQGTIQVTDQETLTAGAGDDVVIRSELLPPNQEVTMNTNVALFPLPPRPFNFNHWTWPSGRLRVYFMPDGIVTSDPAAPTLLPQSFTLTMYVPISPGNPDLELTSGITLFGPTGSVRAWGYDPASGEFEEN